MILNSIYADKGKVFGLSLAMICLFQTFNSQIEGKIIPKSQLHIVLKISLLSNVFAISIHFFYKI